MATKPGFEWINRKDIKEASEVPPQDEQWGDMEDGLGRFDSRHQAFALQLTSKNGNRRAIMYGSITDLELNPSKGIRIAFESKSSEEVWITGRNLNLIFDYICDGRRKEIKEGGSQTLSSGEEMAVEAFEWVKAK